MTPVPRSKDWSLPVLVAVASIAGTAGAALLGVVVWLGGGIASPDARFAKLERYDSTRKITVDSMFLVTADQMTELGTQVDGVANLLGMLVSMQCVSTNPAIRDAVRQTQVPCARVLRDRGMAP